MTAICQKTLPFAPWMAAASRRLPGVQPVRMDSWLQVDDAYAAQMARRIELLKTERARVLRVAPNARGAERELLDMVLGQLPALGFDLSKQVRCPDGRLVDIDRHNPLETLCHLVQEDFCLLQAGGTGEHVLIGALLCFPASWSLDEKFGKPLLAIHAPVAPYDDAMNKRVERLFSAARAGQPMMRANALIYADPDLFHPHRDSDMQRRQSRGSYIRSERQTILRLPDSNAVVFSIHTYQLPEADLTAEQRQGLLEHPIETAHPEGQT